MNKKFNIYKSVDHDLQYYIDFGKNNDIFWEMRQWCNDNIRYTWNIAVHGYNRYTVLYIFDNEVDVVAFKLRWL